MNQIVGNIGEAGKGGKNTNRIPHIIGGRINRIISNVVMLGSQRCWIPIGFQYKLGAISYYDGVATNIGKKIAVDFDITTALSKSQTMRSEMPKSIGIKLQI